jgi:hypothetical protein
VFIMFLSYFTWINCLCILNTYHVIFNSDCLLCNLEALEPVSFDACSLYGLTAGHLNDLMALTFMGDEKLTNNPLYPCVKPQRPASQASESDQPAASQSLDQMKRNLERLKTALYDEMSQTLEDDSGIVDHNADKKLPVAVSNVSNSQSMRSLNHRDVGQSSTALVESTSLPSVDAAVMKASSEPGINRTAVVTEINTLGK